MASAPNSPGPKDGSNAKMIGMMKPGDPRLENVLKFGHMGVPIYAAKPVTYQGADIIAVSTGGSSPAYAYWAWDGSTWVAVPGAVSGDKPTFHVDYIVHSGYAGVDGTAVTTAPGATARMYKTVQAAVNQWAADNNGNKTMYIYAGNYNESVSIGTGVSYALTFWGESMESVTIGQVVGTALTSTNIGAIFYLRNLTLRGGIRSGGSNGSLILSGTVNSEWHCDTVTFLEAVGGDFGSSTFVNCEFLKGYQCDTLGWSPDGVFFSGCSFTGAVANTFSNGSVTDHVWVNCYHNGVSNPAYSVTGADLFNVRFIGCIQENPGQIFYHHNSTSSYAHGLAFVGCYFTYPGANGVIYIQAAQSGVLTAGPSVTGCAFHKQPSSTNPFIKCSTSAMAKGWTITGNSFSEATGGYVEDLGGVSVTGIFIDSTMGPNSPAKAVWQLDTGSANNLYVGTGTVSGAAASSAVIFSPSTHSHTHVSTTGQTADDHHAKQHPIESTTEHSTSGGTDGTYLRQTGTTTWAWETDYYAVNFIIDGGGAAITTGVKGTIHLPVAGVIEQWKIEGDVSGSIVVDVKKATPSWTADVATPSYATIAGTEKPTLASQVEKRDTALSTWTASVGADDQIQFVVDSASTVTRVTVSLRIRKT